MKSRAAETLLLLAVALPALAQDAAPWLGRWRSLETSKGGIGAMYEFRPNGAIRFSPAAVVDMSYRLESNHLFLPPATVGGPEQDWTLEWVNGNQLRTWAGQTYVEYRRVGTVSDPSRPIIGEWTGTRQVEGRNLTVTLAFAATGKLLMLMPFTSQNGAYSVKGGRITASFAPQGTLNGTIQVSNDILTIDRGDGRRSQFVRY
jgi:hypothetical protein